VSGDGFRRPPLLLQQQPEIVITRRIIRPQLNLSTNEPFGTGEIALLRRYDGKVSMSRRVDGINSQDRSVKALRLSERAPALRRQAPSNNSSGVVCPTASFVLKRKAAAITRAADS